MLDKDAIHSLVGFIGSASDADLEELADRVSAEQAHRQRKREKQAVKDAMNTDPKG